GGFGGGDGSGAFGGGGAGLGGGIFNQGGSVLIANSTLAVNTAQGGSAGFFKQSGNIGSAYGGAVFNLNGRVTLTNDTFAGNVVSPGMSFAHASGSADGGAVYNLSLTAPSFPGGPPATATQAATVTIANTILASSTSGLGGSESDLANRQIDGAATIQATGPNIVSTPVVNTGGTVAGTPVTVAAPVLGPLASNGGPTQTMLPQAGSPAVGAGSTAVLTAANFGVAAPAYDQRGLGFARVVRGRVDIGAVEVQPPPPLAVSGPPGAIASLFVPDPSGNYGSPAATIAPFAGFGGSVRTAVADVDGDGVADTVLVTGPGTPIRVAVVSGADNSTLLVAPFDPFGGDFAGGGFVAAADLDRDGKAEFVVTPDQGGGPRVTIFSLVNGAAAVRANFFGIDDPNFRGGARAAVGDVNGDGFADLVVAAGFGGGPRVAIFDGTTLFGTPTRLVNDFFAFPGPDATTLRNGVFVAAGDVNGDGLADLLFGGGPGGAPRVFILSGAMVAANNVAGAQANPLGNFFVAGNVADRGGVRVAAVDADGDNKADVATGSGEGDAARVRVYLGRNFTGAGEPGTFQDLIPFGGAILPGGNFVG
ncbi:MAG: repeat protein, partial [Gemmataceae bacterium]|nr:repeat protein [Gemmataceae bacterium]